MRFICWLFGHDPATVWDCTRSFPRFTAVRCLRCKKEWS